MADTEFSHNIPRQIWDEFGPQLKSLGLYEKAFGIIDIHFSYKFKTTLIKFVGTQKEYDSIDAETVR